jgi:hypothetical protein
MALRKYKFLMQWKKLQTVPKNQALRLGRRCKFLCSYRCPFILITALLCGEGIEFAAVAGYAIIVLLIPHCGKMHAIKSILRSFKLWAPVSHMRGGR